MIRPYNILNQCLLELRNCLLPLQAKQAIERTLIALKSLILEERNPPPAGSPLGEQDYLNLYHLLRHACALDSRPADLEKLLAHLAALRTRLEDTR